MANLLGSTDPVGTPDDQKQAPPPPQPAAQTAAPTPPAGYKVDPKPPAGYSLDAPTNNDDMFETPVDVTAEGAPFWTERPFTVKAPEVLTLANGRPSVAYVDPAQGAVINVENSAGYNPATAAHERFHTYQNKLNDDFQDNLHALLPNGTQRAEDYNYGGLTGLKAHPELGSLNAEKQAQIVGDLTALNMIPLRDNSPESLRAWDDIKKAYERPIQQALRVPKKPDRTTTPTVSAEMDDWLKEHPDLRKYDTIRAILPNVARPIQHIHDMLFPPKPDATPAYGTPDAPSTALGYKNPSKYVRGGDYVLGNSEK